MDPFLAGSYLTVDLGALQENYRILSSQSEVAECAAVVKADAYGLGLKEVSLSLDAAGCRKFFVALPSEAVRLRKYLPAAEIFVLGGLFDGAENIYIDERITPVLNCLDEIKRWSKATEEHGPLSAMIHLDTGITRLGLLQSDIEELNSNPHWLDGLEIRYIISHLACADTPEHPHNDFQLSELHRLRALLPPALHDVPVSFTNSCGIFLGPDFQFDLLRPGIALYGGNPVPGQKNPMKQVIHLQGKVLQVHDVDSKNAVGYGATWRCKENARVATVSVGYADGYFRALGDVGECAIENNKVSVIGRVSMDMISIDVTGLSEDKCQRGTLVSLIGGAIDLDELATQAGTISYELLTALGHRSHRRYINAVQ
ncbi:alanine racemase [Sneathiella sp.]|jgi:alanine racemase|uniref:alanine racemase n=1 Tax=Sneathiella sp. TaxID=1964365 RepID=UPI0039E58578